MKKKFEIVNSNWIRVFEYGNTTEDLEVKMIKLDSVTTLTSGYNSYGKLFRITLLLGSYGPSIAYQETEVQEYKRDLAFFEGMLLKF